jgi:hypothetical protein
VLQRVLDGRLRLRNHAFRTESGRGGGFERGLTRIRSA